MMNKKELDFAVFCIESVAESLGLNGAEIYTKLKYDSDIFDEYIVKCYEALHTQGKEWIERDIIEYMAEKGLLI